MEQQKRPQAQRYVGFVALYGFWSIAVLSRALSQYIRLDTAGLPTHLSLLAGLIYLAITICAWRGQIRLVRWGLWLECIGVVVVSIGEQYTPLAYASAWSHYGAGYLMLPIILPVGGLILAYRAIRTHVHHRV